MNAARALPVTVTLADGRVLLAGGVDDQGNVLASAELYDPATGLWHHVGRQAEAPLSLRDISYTADGMAYEQHRRQERRSHQGRELGPRRDAPPQPAQHQQNAHPRAHAVITSAAHRFIHAAAYPGS